MPKIDNRLRQGRNIVNTITNSAQAYDRHMLQSMDGKRGNLKDFEHSGKFKRAIDDLAHDEVRIDSQASKREYNQGPDDNN